LPAEQVAPLPGGEVRGGHAVTTLVVYVSPRPEVLRQVAELVPG